MSRADLAGSPCRLLACVALLERSSLLPTFAVNPFSECVLGTIIVVLAVKLFRSYCLSQDFCTLCWSKPLTLELLVFELSFLWSPSKAGFLPNLSDSPFPIFLLPFSVGELARSSSRSTGKLTGLILVLGVCLCTLFAALSDFRRSSLGLLQTPSIFWDADSSSRSKGKCTLLSGKESGTLTISTRVCTRQKTLDNKSHLNAQHGTLTWLHRRPNSSLKTQFEFKSSFIILSFKKQPLKHLQLV